MTPLINPMHVKSLYRILRHGSEYSDVRCVNVNEGRIISREVIQGEDNIVKWAQEFNGKGNCFIGRNPRNPDGTVSRITTVSFDIDPIRPKGTSATDDQVKSCVMAARRVLSHYRGGLLALSGNGVLVLYPGVDINPEAIKDFEARYSTFEKHVREVISDVSGVVCDRTYDSARMIKLMGTLSVKGDPVNWRMARFIDLPASRTDSKAIVAGISSCFPTATGSTVAPTGSVFPSRSEADFALALHYKKAGMGPDDTREALKKHALGRQNDHRDQERIIAKVFGNTPVSVFDTPISVSDFSAALDRHKERFLNPAFRGIELETGFRLLDKYIGGLRRQEITTVAARTGVGKTSIAVRIALQLAQRGKKVLFFTTEMSTDTIIERFISVCGGVSAAVLQSGPSSEKEKELVEKGYAQLKEHHANLVVCDHTSPRIGQVRSSIMDHRPDVVIFDHLQHIGGGSDNTRMEVSNFVRGLKDAAREANCAVLALSQIRRLFKDAKTHQEVEPGLTDLKESGTIEEESSAVVILSQISGEPTDESVPILANVAKNRYGPLARIGLEFHRPTTTFRDLEVEADGVQNSSY